MTKYFRTGWKNKAVFVALLLQLPLCAQDLRAISTALGSRDFEKALALCREASAKTPADARLWTLEGVAFSGLQSYDEALKAFQHAQMLSPDYLPALEGKAQIEFKLHVPAATATLQHVLRIKPDDPVAHAMLGELSYQHKDCESTLEHYRKSESLIRSQAGAVHQFATCLVEAGKFEEAVSRFQDLLTLNPQDDFARYNLAAAQLAAHRSEDALATLTALKGTAHVSPGKVAELKSSAYEMHGDTQKAVETLRAAIVKDPGNEDLYISFATLCLDHRSYDVAVTFLNAGVQAVPKSSRLHVARGILYVQLGEYDKAATDFETAERLDPLRSFGSLAEGLSLMQQSKLDQALATTEMEIKRNPNDPFLYYLKAETLRRQGVEPGNSGFVDALLAARQAVKLSPHFAQAHDLLGTLYLKSGQAELAGQSFQLALADEPNDPSALYHMLTIAKRTNNTKLSSDLLKRLAEAKRSAHDREVESSRYRIVEATNAAGMAR